MSRPDIDSASPSTGPSRRELEIAEGETRALIAALRMDQGCRDLAERASALLLPLARAREALEIADRVEARALQLLGLADRHLQCMSAADDAARPHLIEHAGVSRAEAAALVDHARVLGAEARRRALIAMAGYELGQQSLREAVGARRPSFCSPPFCSPLD